MPKSKLRLCLHGTGTIQNHSEPNKARLASVYMEPIGTVAGVYAAPFQNGPNPVQFLNHVHLDLVQCTLVSLNFASTKFHEKSRAIFCKF